MRKGWIWVGVWVVQRYAVHQAPAARARQRWPVSATACQRFLSLSCVPSLRCRSYYRSASASSALAGSEAKLAFDGNPYSRWTSARQLSPEDVLEKQWLAVDLGAAVELESVRLYWDNATFSFASEYTLSVSNSSDAGDWTVVFRESQGNGGFDEIALPAGSNGRHVRLDCLVAGSSPPPPPPPPPEREMVVGKLYNDSDIP